MEMARAICKAVNSGHKVLIAGNGGLAAEAEHFAAELMGKYAFDIFIPCIALTTNTSLITALANDICYEKVFEHQVIILGNEGDVFIGLTTSHSPAILKACQSAKINGLDVWQLDGDILQGDNTADKQEYALHLLHALAYDIKKELYDTGYQS